MGLDQNMSSSCGLPQEGPPTLLCQEGCVSLPQGGPETKNLSPTQQPEETSLSHPKPPVRTLVRTSGSSLKNEQEQSIA